MAAGERKRNMLGMNGQPTPLSRQSTGANTKPKGPGPQITLGKNPALSRKHKGPAKRWSGDGNAPYQG